MQLSELNIKQLEKIKSKIFVVPHGVDLKQFYPKNDPGRDSRMTFLAVKGWADGLNDRGGNQYLIKAFVEEFKEDEAKLIVKINGAYGGSEAHVGVWLKEMGIEKLPGNVELIFEDLPYCELVDLYNNADVFVCPTRGESFNLPGIEAMAVGLPTIQTGFGGQTDYMTIDNSWFINFDLNEVTHNPLLEGIKWATPKHGHLMWTLRYCREHPEEVIKKGNQALEDSKKWTWENSAKKANEALKKIKK